jgi:hypothetical protein
VRNEELYELISTMRDLERTWNNKFNYPYIFFNDKPFTEEFKQKTQAVTKAKIQYGTPARSRSGHFRLTGKNGTSIANECAPRRVGPQGTLGCPELD